MGRMEEFFSSENCEIIFGERHVQSWEWNTAAIPFSFNSFSDFARFFSESEIKFQWLRQDFHIRGLKNKVKHMKIRHSCLSDYSSLVAPETKTSSDDIIRKLQFRSSDENLIGISPRQLSSYVEDDSHRLMPCFTKFKIERIDHYT